VQADVWVQHMGEVLRDDAATYPAILLDLYAPGDYLVRMKYRYLRASYVCFLAAFLATGVAQLVKWAT
jgi:hypothetical protein